MKKLASALLIFSLLLMIVPIASANGLPTSCSEIKKGNPTAADGEYTIFIDGNSASIYCHNMSGPPTEYLTLVHTGDAVNASYYGTGRNSNGLTTKYSKVRFDPSTLTINIADTTFSTSTGYKRFGNSYYYINEYATAGDCVGGGSSSGRGNVDLTGTPFYVQPNQFVTEGNNQAGSNVYSSNGQVVNLTGGGSCGGTGPAGSPSLKLGIVDNAAPVTQAALPSTSNVAGWYNSNFTATLTATDNQSGIQKINYSLNGAAYVEVSGAAAYVPITADGVYTLRYYAVDSVGNTEQEKSISIKLDKTAPTFSLSSNGDPFVDGTSYMDDQKLTFILTSDDALSGVANQTITIEGQSYVNGTTIDLAGKLGVHTLHIVITDQAGNTTDASVNVQITATPEGIANLIDRYVGAGELKGPLLAQLSNSLDQAQHQLDKGDKGKAAKHMQDFLKHLDNKTMADNASETAKSVLTVDANALIEAWTSK